MDDFTTRELGPDTWPAFEALFAPGTGWAFCASMLYQRGCHLPRSEYPSRALARQENHRQKRELVEAGEAHGILVFDGGEPVGWCQFGAAAELPRPGATRLDRRIPPRSPDVDWRITCFVTAVAHRRRGVAATALQGAVAAIAHRGGGVVEGYPAIDPTDANWSHSGTISLFADAGFELHERGEQAYAVMRRPIDDRSGA